MTRRVPVFEAMGAVSLLALVGNGTCLALLWNSGWPDLVIGLALAALLLRSAVRVIRHAIAELRPHQQHRGVPA